MKIVQLNATDTGGGAANACKRLTEALLAEGTHVNLLSQKQKGIQHRYNHYYINNKLKKLPYLARHLQDRQLLKPYNYQGNNFSATLHGASVHKLPLIKEADIIHLHWINDSFLSPEEIFRISNSGKRIVWTLHDMWPFTGGCHYSGNCLKYINNCGKCPELQSNTEEDLSRKIHRIKEKFFSKTDLHIITPSQWLADIASQSSLFKDKNIHSIPNALNTKDIFIPLNKTELKQKAGISPSQKVILFGAVAAIEDERKGFTYLVEALQIIAGSHPELKENIILAIFGSDNAPAVALPFKHILLGKLKTDVELVEAYNLADVLVTPSLQDNLPTTIMEAMACSVPVVGFNIGGIPEMIDHKTNGFVANARSATDLAAGIKWILDKKETELESFHSSARNKAVNEYAYDIIAKKHISVYQEIL